MSIRRLAVLCTAMLCAGMLVLCRVFWIAADQSYAASAAAQTVSETVLPIRRGNFYDRIGRPLTGVTPRWYALCIPGDSSYATLFPFVPFAQQAQLYARRNSITPFLIEVEDDLSANGVFMVADARRYLPTPIARHLIGYLDGDGHGMTGLEKAYDDLLAAAGDAQAVLCTTTARGDLLAGTTPQVQTTARGTNTAITLTLDANIQRACEAIAAQNMSKGCIIVMQVGSGQILASTSMPEFDPDDIAASIRADDTSLINRSLSAFSAGSVFKVVLAAAAYAQGLDWFTYDCTGSIQTAGETFRCALGRAHGTVNLRGALEQSCNCYFIALGQLLGGQAILNAAQSFGLGTPALLAPGLKSAAGELPSAADLQNAGSLASLSFGQGGLAMLRVVTGIPVAYILLPGYVLALGLSFVVPPIFVGIAFDSGGVASGPMTTTFLLPLSIGACETLGGNVMTDAFGVVALVALTPLIAVQLMGVAYRIKMSRVEKRVVPAFDGRDEIVELEEEWA